MATSAKAGGICLIDNKLTFYRQHSSNVIGAKNIEAPKIVNIINFVIEPRDQIVLEKRNAYKQEIGRLTSYLQSSIWTSRERRITEQNRKLFEIYVEELQCNLIIRMFILPQRILCAVMGRRFRAVVGVVFEPYFLIGRWVIY